MHPILAEIFGMDGVIVLIIVIAVLFGSSQIPKLARSLGSAQSEFKKGLEEGSKSETTADESNAGDKAARPTVTGRRRVKGIALPIPAGAPGPRADAGRAPRRRPDPLRRPSTGRVRPGWSPGRGCPSTSAHSGLLLVAAGAFGLLAITARGPLGLVRVCGPRLHAILDIVVAVAVARPPWSGHCDLASSGSSSIEVVALGWLRLATLTRYPRAGPTRPGGGGRPRDRRP